MKNFKNPYENVKVKDLPISKMTIEKGFLVYRCICGVNVKLSLERLMREKRDIQIICFACNKKFKVLYNKNEVDKLCSTYSPVKKKNSVFLDRLRSRIC